MQSNYNKKARMAEITEELNSWFSDKTKADWIEIKIIQRLRQLDTQNIFIAVFNDTLKKCNDIRPPNLKPNEAGVYIVATQKIKPHEFTDSNHSVQSVLARAITENLAL